MSQDDLGEVYDTAYELYTEMNNNRSLEIRDEEDGRDDMLYQQLCDSIGCREDGLANYLENNPDLSAKWFLEEFMQLAAPFAEMFVDILDFLSSEQGPDATEDLRIRFGFDNQNFTEIDLEEFREMAATAEKVASGVRACKWPENTLYDLLDFADHANIETLPEPPSTPKDSDQLPRIQRHHNDEFEKIIRRIRSLVQDLLQKYSNIEEQDSNDQLFTVQSEEKNQEVSPDKISAIVHDILGTYPPLFNYHHEVSEEDRRNAVSYYNQAIRPELTFEGVREFESYESPLDILRLPFWEHRWHTYEIWMTVQTLDALKQYNPKVNVTDGRIPIDGGDTAVVAELQATKEPTFVISELETEFKTEDWESIRPDLSICDAEKYTADSRVVVIEYKQRAALKRNHVNEVAEKYTRGAPNSVGLAIVNYDETPDMDLEKGVELFPKVQPDSHTLREYQELIKEYFRSTDLGRAWTILVDVSGSMREYDIEKNVEEPMREFFEKTGYKPNVYKFNQGLTNNPELTGDQVSNGLNIHGSTDLDSAITELHDKGLHKKNLFIISDGDYHLPDSVPAEIENIIECNPFKSDLESKISTHIRSER